MKLKNMLSFILFLVLLSTSLLSDPITEWLIAGAPTINIADSNTAL